MLSSILSRIFIWISALIFIATIITVICDIRQQPIRFSKSTHIGRPGISVTVRRENISEQTSPDTTVNYKAMRPDSTAVSSGSAVFNGLLDSFSHDLLNKHIAAQKAGKEILSMDTVITLMRQFNPEKGYYNSSRTVIMQDNTGSKPDETDSFIRVNTDHAYPSFSDLNRASLAEDFPSSNIILEDKNITEKLRVNAANKWQQVFFILYNIVQSGCLALLFFFLGRLFRNFKNQEYFNLANISLLRITGWMILVPQIVSVAFYYLFLVRIHPIKLQISDDDFIKPLVRYDITSDIDFILVFLGIGLLILSYIFKNGFKIKELQEFTI